MTTEEIKEKLIIAGVKNLKEFGYPDVTTENILIDEVYKQFFIGMLDDNKGHGVLIDETIEELKNKLQ